MNDDPITPMARAFRLVAFATTIVIAALLGGLVVIVYARQDAADAKTAAKANNQILDIIIAVTGCDPKEPPPACTAKMRAASIAEGTRRINEVDCVHRRALAKLPAPEPGRFCTEQTPADVYPG